MGLLSRRMIYDLYYGSQDNVASPGINIAGIYADERRRSSLLASQR